MKPERLSLVIFVIAVAVIAGAFYFQDVVGLKPCELCLKERIPWYAAIIGAGVWSGLRHGDWVGDDIDRPLMIAFALLFAGSTLFAAYHVGVEHHLIAGPTACTTQKLADASIEDLTRQLLATPPVLCDVVQWSLFGISLAGWNALVSLSVVVLCYLASGRQRGGGDCFERGGNDGYRDETASSR